MVWLGQLSSTELAGTAGFLVRLPFFLRQKLTPEEARATLRSRLENRETDFLALARRTIYPYPGNPYRQLLRLAGCEYGDLERLVQQDGLVGALTSLYQTACTSR